MLLREKKQSRVLQIRSNKRADLGGRPLDLEEQVLAWIPDRQDQQVPIAPPDPFGGQPLQLAPEGGDIRLAEAVGGVDRPEHRYLCAASTAGGIIAFE